MNSDPEANKPTLDRSTLLPILLGVFSLFGILLVFLIGRFNAERWSHIDRPNSYPE